MFLFFCVLRRCKCAGPNDIRWFVEGIYHTLYTLYHTLRVSERARTHA